ncbi:OmpA family protein [Marivirga sp.]|uniref:OmpA family protein n=1 Tax=Marivirga sp. TaxID=2018662 RepID=UPI003DA783BD
MKYCKKIYLSIIFSLVCFLGLSQSQKDSIEQVLDSIYPKQIVSEISTENFTEYAPSISANGRTLIYESNKDGSWKLYLTREENGVWTDEISLDSINNFGDSIDVISGPNFSYDGNRIYFHASFDGGQGSEDIYYSERIGDSWSKPQNLGSEINTRSFDGFPTITTDGKTLYFARNSKNTPEGVTEFCYELYVTHKTDSGWTEPKVLPYPVNLGCEKAPKIMADNRTLIFASLRESGMGGFDLYQTQLNADGDWKSPVPLEYVNTTDNDLFSCISASGEIMYFSKKDDIYSVKIPEEYRQFQNVTIQGLIRDADSQNPLSASLRITDANTSELITSFDNNPSDGYYSIVLSAGRAYNLEVRKDDFSSALYYYDLRDIESYQEYEKNIDLFTTAHLNVNIYDIELYDPLKATITVKNDIGRTVDVVESDGENWKTQVDLPIGSAYNITVESENFKSKNFSIDLKGLILYREYEQDIELVPEKVGVPINVNDLLSGGSVSSSQLIIRNKTRNEEIVISGNQTINLRVGDRYMVEASSDRGYAFNSTEIGITKEGKLQTIDEETGEVQEDSKGVELKLQPLAKDANLTLKDIYFESNSSDLFESSFEELDRVIKLMQSYPSMKIEIAAHTDDIGAASYNVRLSKERANSVIDYITSNNIKEDRLISEGYGESNPVVPNDSDENRAKNRRVELKILDIKLAQND